MNDLAIFFASQLGLSNTELAELADWASSQGDALFDIPDYICPAL